MRILMLTQWFEPEPTFKGLLFARELQRLGHEVEVLTGFPNYPGGRVYPGYRIRPWQREVVGGVPVTRVALYPSHDNSGARRALNYLSFAGTATLAIPFLRRPDVVYVYHPPATTALPAMVLRTLRGVPFVYDVQDLWPDTLSATGMVDGSRVLGLVGRVMAGVYRQAAEVVVLSDGFRRRLVERRVPEEKVAVIHNWNAEDQISLPPADGVLRRELGLGDAFTVVFAGTMGHAQSLESVLDAAHLLRDDPDVRWVFVGGGVQVDHLRARAAEQGLDSVTFLDRRPASEIGEVLAMADALLVHLKADPLFEITVPSKTQAYLMAGRPILMGVAGDAADLIDKAGAGISFEPDAPAALVDAVSRLRALRPQERAEMGRRGQAFYASHLALEVGAARFSTVLERAARSRHRFERSKRAVDFLGAAVGLTLGALPMAVLAVLVRRKLGSPVIFRQERPGRHGQPFMMLKFRTMTDEVGPDGELLPDSVRLTGFGRRLRSTSLDELPELVNVLRGDMSLVGPRPLLSRYTEFFTAAEGRRLDVRPGITGLAQVRGRNLAAWDHRLALDVKYVERISPLLDLRVIWETLRQVVRSEGVVVDPESVMMNLDDERRLRQSSPS